MAAVKSIALFWRSERALATLDLHLWPLPEVPNAATVGTVSSRDSRTAEDYECVAQTRAEPKRQLSFGVPKGSHPKEKLSFLSALRQRVVHIKDSRDFGSATVGVQPRYSGA